jgi:hypothetical protein
MNDGIEPVIWLCDMNSACNFVNDFQHCGIVPVNSLFGRIRNSKLLAFDNPQGIVPIK